MNWEKYKDAIKGKGGLEEDWYILGIDLGTTNSVISYWNSKMKRPEPIDVSNGFGRLPLPSVVQYRKEEDSQEEWIIGEEALHTIKIFPESTVRSIKRKMGTREKVALGGRDYMPEEISAMILKHLIAHVEAMNPRMEMAGVVVSVPYDFDDAAKKATIKACHLAGLSESLICLIEEPKAAALAYSFRHDLDAGEKVMVFDFGGGTLDITVFHVDRKDEEAIHMKVISEGGEAYHGGDNVDDIIYQQLLFWLEDRLGRDRASLGQEAVAELCVRATEAKERLSGVTKHRVPFTFCVPPFVEKFSREDMEKLIEPFVYKTKKLVMDTLEQAYERPLQPDEITRVLLEGGSSRMPWVRQMLSDIFMGEDRLYVSEQPALDISIGATYYGAMKLGLLEHKDIHTLDRRITFETPVPHDIGFEVSVGDSFRFYPMIRRGTPYPLARRSMTFTLSGKKEELTTDLDMRILERMKEVDGIEDCRLVENVEVKDLPLGNEGKTRVEVTLSIDEKSGTATGNLKLTEGETVWHF